MKVLIWLGCLFAGSLVQLFLGYAGIGGALPTMVVFCGMFASAVSLCKRYDAYRNRASASKSVSLARSAAAPVQPPEPSAQDTAPAAPTAQPPVPSPQDTPAAPTVQPPVPSLQDTPTAPTVQPPEPPAQSVSAAPIVYCRKCGQRLIPDSAFCSFCGTAIIKE